MRMRGRKYVNSIPASEFCVGACGRLSRAVRAGPQIGAKAHAVDGASEADAVFVVSRVSAYRRQAGKTFTVTYGACLHGLLLPASPPFSDRLKHRQPLLMSSDAAGISFNGLYFNGPKKKNFIVLRCIINFPSLFP
jgi:hypothetical protein